MRDIAASRRFSAPFSGERVGTESCSRVYIKNKRGWAEYPTSFATRSALQALASGLLGSHFLGRRSLLGRGRLLGRRSSFLCRSLLGALHPDGGAGPRAGRQVFDLHAGEGPGRGDDLGDELLNKDSVAAPVLVLLSDGPLEPGALGSDVLQRSVHVHTLGPGVDRGEPERAAVHFSPEGNPGSLVPPFDGKLAQSFLEVTDYLCVQINRRLLAFAGRFLHHRLLSGVLHRGLLRRVLHRRFLRHRLLSR